MLVENPKKEPKWLSGIVVEKQSPKSYLVKVGTKIVCCHVNQMLITQSGTSSLNTTDKDEHNDYILPPRVDNDDIAPPLKLVTFNLDDSE